MNTYDSIIIGGGPAGLSAAIYLARFNRTVLILDSAQGRWKNHEINQNYLGFPGGISAVELRDRGLQQALSFGAEYVHDTVVHIAMVPNSDATHPQTLFRIDGQESYQAKSLIFATGVKDLFPNFPRWQEYLGNSLFWCITCDGYKVRNKKVVIVGHDEEAACTALQFLQLTSDVSLVTHLPVNEAHLPDKWRQRLEKFGVPLYEGVITDVAGHNGQVETITLSSGTHLSCQALFNLQGSVPCSKLASFLNVAMDEKGFILTDENQKTNVPFVYAAGDVTKAFAHQIITAAHEGSMAAQAANYDLYLPEQRTE